MRGFSSQRAGLSNVMVARILCKGKLNMKKKHTKKINLIISLALLLIASLFLVSCGDDDEDDEDYEDYEYSESTDMPVYEKKDVATSGASEGDSFTLLVYICGSNLESEDGAATYNLNQMVYSNAGDNLKVIIETGGAKEWQNDVITADSLQRYEVSSEGLELLEDVGNYSIADSDQLSDFIKFGVDNYPADRYGFIFWDHGGGTIGGYGADELFDDKSMTISDIQDGFEKAGKHFEFIGFDCCLMSTIEIANALHKHADYMVASEEIEPGTGWYYTNFMNLIEENPGVSMVEIGKQIIDDYNSEEYTWEDEDTTLSLIDLNQIPNIMDKLNDYMEDSERYLVADGYNEISQARSGARSFGNNEFEQVDIVDYLGKLSGVDGSELKKAVDDAVIYHGTRIRGTNGLAMYYPYFYTEYYGEFRDLTNTVGMSDELYNQFFEDFVSLQTGGQVGGGGVNPYSSDGENYDYEQIQEEAWYDAELVSQYEEYYSQVDTDELEITEKGDGYVLQLSEEDWEIVTDVQLQVFLDDGEGYLSLGSDDAVEYDDDGDLLVEYDYTWLYLNDCLVPYYADHAGERIDGSFYSIGYIPAYLNGEENDIQIWVRWTESNPSGEILGYTVGYDNTVAAKGYKSFRDGDVIDFPFDYYTYDSEYEDSYLLEDNTLYFDVNNGFDLYYGEVGDLDSQILFYLKDVYQNEYWTEPLYYTDN